MTRSMLFINVELPYLITINHFIIMRLIAIIRLFLVGGEKYNC